MNIKITGTGSYIPNVVEKNEDFYQHQFLNSDGSIINSSNEVIIEKFKAITGIGERRYADHSLSTSNIAFYAAKKAIEDAKINPEELDYIIVAHNYGDIKHGTQQSDTVPSIASRVKHLLKIKNPKCVGYDMLFGCPGWIEATIQANAFIKSGIAKKCLIIGAETLSRVIDKHDRDVQSHDIAKLMRPDIKKIVAKYNANVKIVEVPPGPPVLSTIVAEVYGPEYDKQIEVANEVKNILKNTQDVVDIDWMVEDDQIEYEFIVDKEKAMLYGVAPQQIVYTMNMAFTPKRR